MRLKLLVVILGFIIFNAAGAVEAWWSLVDRIRGEPSFMSIDLGTAWDIYRLAMPIIGIGILLAGVWWIERRPATSIANEADSPDVRVTNDPQGLYGRLKIHNDGDKADFRAVARFVGEGSVATQHTTPWPVRWRRKDEEYVMIGKDAENWLDVASRELSVGPSKCPILRFWQATASIGSDTGKTIYSHHFDLSEGNDAVDIEIRIESPQRGQLWKGRYVAVMLNQGARLIHQRSEHCTPDSQHEEAGV